jgi:Tol biopolymer transport system component
VNYTKFLTTLTAVFLSLALLLAACGEEPRTTPQSSRTLPVNTTPNPGFGAPQNTPVSGGQPQPAATPTQAGPRPQVGANGEITVVAPPANGINVSGIFFWVNQNNIWQGGKDTKDGRAITPQNLGGKQLTRTSPLAIAKSPALSPDGTRVAYAYSPEPEGTPPNIIIGQDIYVLDLKTTANTLLVKRDEPLTFLDNPAWSADGKYLYFDGRTPTRDNRGQITGETLYISRIELETGKREKLAPDAREPTPLLDGSTAVFVSVNASTGTYETTLKLVDINTKAVRHLLKPEMSFLGAYMPRPAPDGKTIVFAAPGGPGNTLSLPGGVPGAPLPMNPTPKSGGVSTRSLGMIGLLKMPGTSTTLDVKKHGLPYDLWTIKVDSTDLRRVTTLFEDQPMAAWSSDGSTIVFLAGQGFYSIKADGTNLTKHSSMGGHAGFVWRDKI